MEETCRATLQNFINNSLWEVLLSFLLFIGCSHRRNTLSDFCVGNGLYSSPGPLGFGQVISLCSWPWTNRVRSAQYSVWETLRHSGAWVPLFKHTQKRAECFPSFQPTPRCLLLFNSNIKLDVHWILGSLEENEPPGVCQNLQQAGYDDRSCHQIA